MNLHNAASEESKALAYDAMAKALSSPPVVKEPALPVKAMPPLPPWRQELFMQQMASQLSSMLIESLGMPMPLPGPKAAVLEPKAAAPAPLRVPWPKAAVPAPVGVLGAVANEIHGDTTEEEEGEEPTRDP